MTDRHDPQFPPRARLTDEDRAVIDLVSRFIERSERGQTASVHDLLATAAEFGDSAAAKVRAVLASYETMRATTTTNDPTRSPKPRPRDIKPHATPKSPQTPR